MLVMIILGLPFLVLVIFLRIQQTYYSLSSPLRTISLEELLYYPSSIPHKLIEDNHFILAITILTLSFWALSFWDLLYYYYSIDSLLMKQITMNKILKRIRSILTSIMWIFILTSLYVAAVYILLVAIWLVLSAIINPDAFLPYTTSALTFATFLS